tara:strand:+ start:1393 stop:1533 length:141 start_codon:yes stop_codon:yes gene_type:complete
MGKFSLFLFSLVLLTVVGGAAALLTVDIPPPSSRVEKVLPDDSFPK